MNAAETNDNLVLPRWLSFRKAARQREANVFSDALRPLDYGPSRDAFNEALDEFRKCPSPFIGSELMGIAQALGEESIARELAEYTISQPIVGTVAHNQAKTILTTEECAIPVDERARIRDTKKRLRDFPADALSWIEQARLYTITGHRLKARRAVVAALHLAPSDRYVVRAAIRFFVHCGEWETALHYAKAAYSQNQDPLIFGPMLSVATRVEKLPAHLKVVAGNALTASNTLLYSETLEAIGTLEIMEGAEKRSRRFFKQAWTDPTRSVVDHSQWVLREHLPNLALEQEMDFSDSPQAVSWLRFAILNFDGAVVGTQEWALEEPYSRSPYILGSYAAGLGDDFATAEEIARRGLITNPGDQTLLNNLTFALLKRHKIAEAEKTFAPLMGVLDNPAEIAPVASHGLLLMSQGKFEEGSRCYETAIHRAKESGSHRVMVRAALNFAIASIETAGKVDVDILKSMTLALKETKDSGAFGTAMGLARRLKNGTFKTSEELQSAARAFIERVNLESPRFTKSVLATLLPSPPTIQKTKS